MRENKASVLVVDDIAANRKLAGRILADEFAVDSVSSGEEAVDFLTRNIPDLVLLDIYMDGIDGFEVLAQMQAHMATAEVPVIFLTADDDHEVEIRGLKAGAEDFITKPFIPAIMQERVRRTIELSHLRKDLKKEAAKQSERLSRLSLQVVQVVVKTLDMRNARIKGHSRRVADYAWKIADRMGKPQPEKEEIYYMGMLHEIGRIVIPDRILQKKGMLTEKEEEIVQQATITGAEMLKDVTELPDMWKGARYYRENYDGTGYPDGLQGEAIPEPARIIAAAGMYDLLVKAEGLPAAEIRQRIAAASGRRLDPVIAEVLLSMLADGSLEA